METPNYTDYIDFRRTAVLSVVMRPNAMAAFGEVFCSYESDPSSLNSLSVDEESKRHKKQRRAKPILASYIC